MKKVVCTFLACVFVLLSLCSCANGSGEQMKITLDDSLPQAAFAAEEIRAAVARYNINNEAGWSVSFDGVDESLGEQGYRIVVEDKKVSITGGDATGLMYGGLEVADQIRMSGLAGIKNACTAPDIKNRAVKFHVPLDMRTPSYSDTGDMAQNNIANMWDMDFWTAQIDAMARSRFNALTIWNLNPFPSMVKVPGYEDIALDDVWRTTLKFDSTYNNTATNIVRPEHWENYEVVKEITIDEKIKFWQEVMRYAHDHGVDFYLYTWNVYTFAENGKYGITPDMENETTAEYFKACVKEMIKTYPYLDGIGITVGEQMYNTPDTEQANEEWLYRTYGEGINEALDEETDREFTLIHRLHLADFELSEAVWKDFRGNLEYSDKYTMDHMYSSVSPTFSNDVLDKLPGNRKMWLEMRNDDMYYYRWGDPDFTRDLLSNMPDGTKSAGFMIGADGYIPAREYAVADEELQGQLYIERKWYSYDLWGRLGYSLTLSNDYFTELMVAHFKDEIDRGDAELLAKAAAAAGKIVPQVSRLYFSNGEPDWYPEGCLSHPLAFGFLNMRRWINSANCMPDAGVMSIAEYAAFTAQGETQTDMQTPPEVAAALRVYAEEAIGLAESVQTSKPDVLTSVMQKEFYGMLADQQTMAYLGLYYAEKIDAAVELRLYNDTQDAAHQDASIKHLNSALEYWKLYAEAFSAQYLPQRLDHKGDFDPAALTQKVEEDISIAEKWKPRKF